MYCSACGHALAPGQPFCTQCGRPAPPVVPAVPNLGFELNTYASRIRALGIVWLIYAVYSLARSIFALMFAHTFFWGFGPWAHGPFGPGFPGPWLASLVWPFLIVRVALAVVAGVGLMQRTAWGRVVAIVAAIFSLLHPIIGTALGIWTLVSLLGFRNTTLYGQLEARP